MKVTLVEQKEPASRYRRKQPSRSGGNVYLKKRAAKAMRRAAKLDPEDAPQKLRYRGYQF